MKYILNTEFSFNANNMFRANGFRNFDLSNELLIPVYENSNELFTKTKLSDLKHAENYVIIASENKKSIVASNLKVANEILKLNKDNNLTIYSKYGVKFEENRELN